MLILLTSFFLSSSIRLNLWQKMSFADFAGTVVSCLFNYVKWTQNRSEYIIKIYEKRD
jgi:hypothetical protein